MQYPYCGLEDHPDGIGSLNAIQNGDWQALAAMFNPAHGLTASQSTTTLTASAAVFRSDDVGATVRFADGTVDTIAGYTSATVVTMTTSQTIGSQAFEVYRIGESPRTMLLAALTKMVRLTSSQDDLMLVYDHTTRRLDFVGPGTMIPSTTKSGADTLAGTEGVVLADATGGGFTLTLPSASAAPKRTLFVKKVDASGNAVQVGTVDGGNHSLAAQYDAVQVYSDGTNWHVIGSF